MFRKAAEQGNAKAQRHLGLMYHEGQGVTRNYAEALKWLRKSAEQGDEGAQRLLAICIITVEGKQYIWNGFVRPLNKEMLCLRGFLVTCVHLVRAFPRI